MALSLSSAVVFIACHGGSADHFATFAQHLANKQDCPIEIYAAEGPALDAFRNRKIEQITSFSLKKDPEKTAIEIAKKCAHAALVITDVGHDFDLRLQEALAMHAPHAIRGGYRDNHEVYVPGGYSDMARRVMDAAQIAIFANADLAEGRSQDIPLQCTTRVGLGYYPMAQVDTIIEKRRLEHGALRKQFFSENFLKDKGQKILVYAGGNNEEYFSKAFPAFLKLLEEIPDQINLSELIVLLQQHPGARSENLDLKLLDRWILDHLQRAQLLRFIISKDTLDEALIVADAMLYYQTSRAPQFVLAGIPTFQIGHEVYEDIVVRNHLCSVITDKDSLVQAFEEWKNPQEIARDGQAVRDGLGMRADWAERLERLVEEAQKKR